MASRENPGPWHIEGQTIRDANGYVVVSAINPCGMATRRRIVRAVNEKTVGNAAAMREACVKARKLAEEIWLGGDGEDMSSEIAELKDALDAALAAPPRNVDKCESLDKARKAWFAEEIQPRLDDIPMGHNEIPFDTWLFASATEKGAGDGE